MTTVTTRSLREVVDTPQVETEQAVEGILDTVPNEQVPNPAINNSIDTREIDIKDEYDTEDEIAHSFLNNLKDMINKELDSKQRNRTILVWFLIGSFSVLGIFLMLFLWNSYWHDTSVVLALISGFFVNMIGLVLVLVKYMFSPSKEIYDYTISIFKRKENGNGS